MRALLAAALLLASTGALAVPEWLDCSGKQKVLVKGDDAKPFIRVMYDDEIKAVHVEDSGQKMNGVPAATHLTPVAIYATMFRHVLFIDRGTWDFKYWRFNAERENSSILTGTCHASANPPKNS